MKLVGTKKVLAELGHVDELYLAHKLAQARDGKSGAVSVELPAKGEMYRFTTKMAGSSVVYVVKVIKE